MPNLEELNDSTQWSANRLLILKSIKDLEKAVGEVQKTINEYRVEISLLKFKMGLIALITSIVGTSVWSFIFDLLKSKLVIPEVVSFIHVFIPTF